MIAKYVERLLGLRNADERARHRAEEDREHAAGGTKASGSTPSRTRSPTSRPARPVVVVDDEDRENEGDLIFAASKSTPELMAFTIRYSSGVICVPMPARCSTGSRSR